MDEKKETTSRESAAEQAAPNNADSCEGQGSPEGLSFEEELRAAYEELEAARRKLEEIKAKNPPVAASASPCAPDDEASHAASETKPADGAGAGPSAPDWVPYTPPAPSGPGSAGQAVPPQGYQPPSYGQQPPRPQQEPQQPPRPQQQPPCADCSQPAGAWSAGAQPQQPYGAYGSSGASAQQPGQQAYGQSGQQAYQSPFQQPYQQPYYPSACVQTKDHVAAGLLGLFLGWLGIHKFYLGYNTTGFIMLAVTVIGSIFTFGLAASVMALIGVIEGIIYLVKSQSEFEQLYVFNKREWF